MKPRFLPKWMAGIILVNKGKRKGRKDDDSDQIDFSPEGQCRGNH